MVSKTTLITLLAVTGFIALLAFVGTGVVRSARHRPNYYTTQGPEDYLGTPTQFVKKINELRRWCARDFNVSNMHQLIWSEDLVKAAEFLKESEVFSDKGRVEVINSYQDAFYSVQGLLKKKGKSGRAVNFKQIIDKDIRNEGIDFLVPNQLYVGCSPKDTTMTCLIGPSNKFSFFDYSGDSTAVPGTQCLDGYVENDGICSPTTETLVEASQEKFPKIKEEDEEDDETSGTNASQLVLVFLCLCIFYVF
ncbi:hypothetical protein GCK72_007594 [Caenorhabditis remanei]|uniref:Uncharacterized protein n=1 Tax=Caenorhabditis remanei TaxID=31234 RepID=A0A6A5HJH0_CAERE|nr:hypothetical protein GCK72_007594 [Caenorhabditis remanei]KAF1767635.1 hypothetical protein GCK72_007594 [Caenorhabditis remanei]